MARTYARIRVDLWRDDDWRALTHDAQWLYLAILGCPRLNVVGSMFIRPASLRNLAVDLEARDIDAALKELDHAGMIAVDDATEELVVRTFVPHDGVLRNVNLARGCGRHGPGSRAITCARSWSTTCHQQGGTHGSTHRMKRVRCVRCVRCVWTSRE